MADPDGLRARRSLDATARRGAYRRVLELLAATPEGLRQEQLMAELGLSRPSVSTLLTELGDVVETSTDAVRPSGRPPRTNRIRPTLGVVAGVDVGKNRVHVTLADLAGQPLDEAPPAEEQIKQEQVPEIAERTLDAAARLVRSELLRLGWPLDALAAVGVSLPGTVPHGAKTTTDPTLRAWHRMDVGGFLRVRLGGLGDDVGVALEHEANAAMLAEQRWGAARRESDVLFVEWSSTISASILIGGRLWRGSRWMAGGVGHVRLPLDESERAVLGLLAEETAIREACPLCRQHLCAYQLVNGHRMGTLLDVETIPEGERAVQERPEALATTKAMARLLGRAIGVGVAVLDPQLVIVSGGAPRALLRMVEPVMREGLYETASPRRPRLALSELGPHAAIRGAIAAAIERETAGYLLRRRN